MTKAIPQRAKEGKISSSLEPHPGVPPIRQHAKQDSNRVSSNECRTESMRERIERVQNDLRDLKNFYSISISPKRTTRLKDYYDSELKSLKHSHFAELDQGDKVDYLLLRAYLERQPMDELDEQTIEKVTPLLRGWASRIIDFCEARQELATIDAMNVATSITEAVKIVKELKESISKGKLEVKGGRSVAFRAAKIVDELKGHLDEAVSFYRDYDPIFTWWMATPHSEAQNELTDFADLIRQNLVGLQPNDEDTIVGSPIGREALLADLKAEFIAYTPEELITIGETEYKTTLSLMITASQDLGHGTDWHSALEAVKNMYVAPGSQPSLVKSLASEATSYVTKHSLVTVPSICSSTTRAYMLSPARQKLAPFFLGGTTIQISYPTSTMPHTQKVMSMRGNSRPFSRATVFHELIPGHHLQSHYIARYQTHRRALFDTPFWMEGWAMYWEYILWDRGDFFETPEDRIGTLFWRLHRCARIVFSVKFHLGLMTSEECVEYLVEKVGHERATAEGEVRRSLSGEYRPLYQCGYMLGALQLLHLRKEVVVGQGEVVGKGKMKEKEFHDRVLKENEMSIEMLRALLKGEKLHRDYEAHWRFYDLDKAVLSEN